jgi:SAM-dependent methyltransferase
VRRLRDDLQPPVGDRLRFHHADFSHGLSQYPAGYFDGVVSGLAVQYAEFFCPTRGQWTTDAYDQLLSEVHRVLRPGGQFVFSVNVPNPSWTRVALHAMPGVFRLRRFLRYLKNSLRMWHYGSWLKREAQRGRFHYLPLAEVVCRLEAAGFGSVDHRLSFARQAYILRCRKGPAAGRAQHLDIQPMPSDTRHRETA